MNEKEWAERKLMACLYAGYKCWNAAEKMKRKNHVWTAKQAREFVTSGKEVQNNEENLRLEEARKANMTKLERQLEMENELVTEKTMKDYKEFLERKMKGLEKAADRKKKAAEEEARKADPNYQKELAEKEKAEDAMPADARPGLFATERRIREATDPFSWMQHVEGEDEVKPKVPKKKQSKTWNGIPKGAVPHKH